MLEFCCVSKGSSINLFVSGKWVICRLFPGPGFRPKKSMFMLFFPRIRSQFSVGGPLCCKTKERSKRIKKDFKKIDLKGI